MRLRLLLLLPECSDLGLELPYVPLGGFVVLRLGNLVFKGLDLLVNSCHPKTTPLASTC